MSVLPSLGLAAIAFLSTLAGGSAALRWPGRTHSLAALAGGVVLAAAFLDLLPDAIERAGELHLSPQWPVGAALGGFLTLYVLERFLHHHHEIEESPNQAGLIGAAGFIVHSFFDGLAIGLGFRVDPALGVLVSMAVIGHDFSDGLNTVSYLVTHHQPARRSRWFLVADAAAPLLGAIVAATATVPPMVFPIAVGFFSGLFVYAGSSVLLPRAGMLSPHRALPLTLGGVGVMFLITRLA